MLKKILWVLILLLVIAQFIPSPKNTASGPQANNIETKHPVPADVKNILAKACNDCHSNNTRYPWYNKMQPVAWWLASHVNEGKEKINFDEFTNKPLRYQYHKLEEVEEQIKEGEMPLPSYTWTHKDAILTDAEKEAVYAWVAASRSAMEATYPADSLKRPKGAPGPEKRD